MFTDAWQIRQQISCCGFAAFIGTEFALVQRLDLAMQVANVNQRIEDLTTGDGPVHHQAVLNAFGLLDGKNETTAMQLAEKLVVILAVKLEPTLQLHATNMPRLRWL